MLGSYQPECPRTLALRVRARAFLQHQVRYMVGASRRFALPQQTAGAPRLRVALPDAQLLCARLAAATLVQVGRGKLTPAAVRTLLEARDNSRAPAPAPAHGLYLTRVEYPQCCLDGTSAPSEALGDGDVGEVEDDDDDGADIADGECEGEPESSAADTDEREEPVAKRQKPGE